jgi:hypothetical protein
MKGTVENLRNEQEGNERVLRFVMRAEGRAIPVEMRGEKLLGVLNEGDCVVVNPPSTSVRDQDETLRPRMIQNVTTSGTVELWRPGSRDRVIRAVGIVEIRNVLIAAIVSSLVTLAVARLAARVVTEDRPPSELRPQGGVTDFDLDFSRPITLLINFLILIGATLLAAGVLYLLFKDGLRRRRASALRAMSVGVVVGVILGALILVLVAEKTSRWI